MRRLPAVPGVILAALLLLAGPNASRGDDSALCSDALATAPDSNTSRLLEGALACAGAGRREDAYVLLGLGQIRAGADSMVLGQPSKEAMAQIKELYSRALVAVDPDLEASYAAPEKLAALERRLRDLELRLDADYDPGWPPRTGVKAEAYAPVVAQMRAMLLARVGVTASNLQDPAYAQAYRAIRELYRSNPSLEEGEPGYDEYLRLTAQLKLAANRFQDPEVAKRLVVSGFNGPAEMGLYVFRSAAEVRQSWLAAALSAEQLSSLLARTDFSQEVFLALAFGHRQNASGVIVLSQLGYDQRGLSYIIAAQVGVVPQSCGPGAVDSFPFVVGVTAAVPGAELRQHSLSNFPDACGPVVSGEATAP